MLYGKEIEGTKAKKINLCKSQHNNFVQKENSKIMQTSIPFIYDKNTAKNIFLNKHKYVVTCSKHATQC